MAEKLCELINARSDLIARDDTSFLPLLPRSHLLRIFTGPPVNNHKRNK